ncbi:MAG: hypothetical protein DWQ28_06655 [Proteobacteria bacterium]|nr:MAG: hypothetical protein DWQ28_06350 [Pseudomonadota bacterium]REJ67712.1 MAG: hypothetical protein DWQ28_06655 [Pseudomonadota bacterium]
MSINRTFRPGSLAFPSTEQRFLNMLRPQLSSATVQRTDIPRYGPGPRAGQPLPPYMDAAQRSAQRAQAAAQKPFVSPLLATAMRGGPATGGAVPSATPMQRIGQAFRQPITSPAQQGMLTAAATGLQLAGPQPVPTSTGQILGQMGMAGLQAFTKAKEAEAARAMKQREIDIDAAYKAADINIKAAKAQKQGPFAGTSMTAQSMNTLLALSPKMEAGKADPQEEQLYRLAYGYLSKPRVETRETDQGTTTVRVPGQDMSAFYRPEGFAEGEEVVGQTSAKFTEGQSNAAAFANRMSAGLMIFDELTSGGYDPTNFQDYLASNLPSSVSGFASTAEGQKYMAAKTDFITAVLRKESGAAISVSEFEKEDRKYFPQPGEGPEVVEQKREARARALQSMIAQSGPAYEVLFGEAEATGIPPGSTFLKRSGGTSYYRDPNGDIIAVDD